MNELIHNLMTWSDLFIDIGKICLNDFMKYVNK